MLPKMFELILDDYFLDVNNLNIKSTKFCEKNASPNEIEKGVFNASRRLGPGRSATLWRCRAQQP